MECDGVEHMQIQHLLRASCFKGSMRFYICTTSTALGAISANLDEVRLLYGMYQICFRPRGMATSSCNFLDICRRIFDMHIVALNDRLEVFPGGRDKGNGSTPT